MTPAASSRSNTHNRPTKPQWKQGAERLFNLIIALVNERRPRSVKWILDNVAGYEGEPRSAEKRFQRDRKALSDIGVHLTRSMDVDVTDEGSRPRELWSLDPSSLFLPEIEFTPEESDVLAVAGSWARSGEMAEAGASAFAKLAAAGARSAVRDTPGEQSSLVATLPDALRLDSQSFDAIFRALESGLVVSFFYYPSLLEEPQERTIEPWAYGAVGGKLYLTGFDRDRGGQRTFRLARIDNIEVHADFAEAQRPSLPATDLILQGLQRAGEMVTATVEFPGEGAYELRTKMNADGTIGPVERAWLVRTAAAYAPNALVTSPPDVVQDIVDTLACAASTGSTGSTEGTGSSVNSAEHEEDH